MRRIWIAVVLSAGLLSGCSSVDTTPKVVGTFCAPAIENGEVLYREGHVQHLVYDDGSVAIMRRLPKDTAGNFGDLYVCPL
jgi:hypothetical protein